jgi:hypothetical protein
LSKTGLTNAGESAIKRDAELRCDGANIALTVLPVLNWLERDLPDVTRKANGRAGWLLKSQQGGGSKKLEGADAACMGQQGIA